MTERILFTSPVQPIPGCSPNVYSWNKHVGAVKIGMSFIDHPGLSFLAANLPGVDILPYPSWDEFRAAVAAGIDILGISFYINETELAVRMAEYARRNGVRRVIAGNYGAYSPQIDGVFDAVVTGWGEAPAASALGVERVDPRRLIHPPMYGCLGTNLLPRFALHGFLFTSRGCPCTCTFCQTPDFYGKAHPVSLESIDEVLWTYRRQGVASVNILDENFGIFPEHTREVLRLLARYRLRFLPLCRVDLLLKNFDEWVEAGLFGAHIGVESLNSDSLDGARKKIDSRRSVELLRKMSRHNLLVQAFYIIGFEEDTVDSVRRDIEELEGLDVDLAQIQILTPYPRTPLRDTVDQSYGIGDGNLSRYNSRNLVWGHPSISPTEMRELQDWAHTRLFTRRRALRTVSKVLAYDCSARLSLRGVACLLPRPGDRALRRQLARGLKGAYHWLRRDWHAYEEVPDGEMRIGAPSLACSA